MNSPALPLEQKSIRHRFAIGIGWNLLAVLAQQGSAFLVNILLANMIGRPQYGKFAVIQYTLVTLAGVGQVAMGVTAAKFVAENRVIRKQVAGEIVGLCAALTAATGLLGAAALVYFSPRISASLLHAPELASGLRIVAVASLFLTVNAYQVGALAGLEVFRSAGLAAAALGLLHVAICAIGGCYFGLQGALWGLLASSVVRWWFFRRILQREMAAQGIPFSWSGWRTQRAILTGFAVPAAICGISSMPALWSINALLARQPGGYALLAAYSAAFQLKSIVTLLPYMFNNVGLSLLNHQRGIGDSAGYLRAFWYNVLLGGGAALAGAVILSVAGRPVLRLYGGTFDDAYVPLLILLGSAVFEGFAIGLFQIVQSDGRMWSAFWRVVLPRDLLSILLASLLVDSYGIIGVATAYSIAWFIGSMLILAYVRRLGFRFSTGFSAHA